MSKFKAFVEKLKKKGMSDKEANGVAYKVGAKKYGASNMAGAAAKKESVESYMKSKKK